MGYLPDVVIVAPPESVHFALLRQLALLKGGGQGSEDTTKES